MSDEKKDEIAEQVTEEHMKFAHLLESTAFIVQQMGQKLAERVNAIAGGQSKLPSPPNFVFNIGTLVGELDQVVHATQGYLQSYTKFRQAYLVKIEHKDKEELH